MNHVQKVGCRPLYLNSLPKVNYLPLCSTSDQIKQATFRFRTDGYGVSSPCTSMEKISYEYEESTIDPQKSHWGKEGTFWIGLFFFNSHFKDIYQTR